jgi:hypothetical protein
MQSKAWMIAFLKKYIFIFFKMSIPSGISLINKHILIFNCHGSYVTLEAIEQAKAFELDMFTLPSHKSHALQPLHITCFKPFRIGFKKERDTTTINRNYIELDKLVLARWVDKALNQTLSRKNILSWGGFDSLEVAPKERSNTKGS